MSEYRQNMLEALARVSEREKARAIAEFEQVHGRSYNGDSDEDWDALDKDYTAVEEAIDCLRE